MADDDTKTINPYRAYSVKETAELIGVHPDTLKRKLASDKKDPFIANAHPIKPFNREWRFLGENILKALGSQTYNSQSENKIEGSGEMGAKSGDSF